MAKSLLKKAKKAVKSKKKEAKSQASTVKEAVKVETMKEVKSTSSDAYKHIESISKLRRDGSVLWGMIKDGNHSTDEIKEICKEKGFDELLGEIS